MTQAITQLNNDIGDFHARVENNIGGIRLVQAFANEHFEKSVLLKITTAFEKRNFFPIKLCQLTDQSAIFSQDL